MAKSAKPPNFKGLFVVVMVHFGLGEAAAFAGLSRESPSLEGVLSALTDIALAPDLFVGGSHLVLQL
jgi:hypothetical protein